MTKLPAKALYSAAHDRSKQTAKRWIADQWVLHDPDQKHVKSGKPLFRKPDGKSTDDPAEAQVFPSKGDAKKTGDRGPENWVTKRLSDFFA